MTSSAPFKVMRVMDVPIFTVSPTMVAMRELEIARLYSFSVFSILLSFSSTSSLESSPVIARYWSSPASNSLFPASQLFLMVSQLSPAAFMMSSVMVVGGSMMFLACNTSLACFKAMAAFTGSVRSISGYSFVMLSEEKVSPLRKANFAVLSASSFAFS